MTKKVNVMEDNTKDVSIVAIIFIFIFLFLMTITSCMKKDEEFKLEQVKTFLDRGCEQVIIQNTSSFYWSNCKK